MKVIKISNKDQPIPKNIKNAICILNKYIYSISFIFVNNYKLHNSKYCSILFIYKKNQSHTTAKSHYLYNHFYFRNHNTSWKKQAKDIKRNLKLKIFK